MYFFGKTFFSVWYDFESDKQRNEIFYEFKNDLVFSPENSAKISQDEVYVIYCFFFLKACA